MKGRWIALLGRARDGIRGLRGPYARLGVALVVGGAVFAAVAGALVQAVPLVALGIAAILVGIVAVALASSLPPLSPEASALLLQTGLENLSALVEEIGLDTPAIYLPSRLAGGKLLALIPLHTNASRPRITRALPARLIVAYGPEPQDMGMLVRTAGTAVMQLFNSRPGSSPAELEAAMTAVLVGRLDLADAVGVRLDGERVVITVDGPRLDQRDLWVSRTLGSPLASIVATMVAEALDRPVQVRSEEGARHRAVIVAEPVDEAL